MSCLCYHHFERMKNWNMLYRTQISLWEIKNFERLEVWEIKSKYTPSNIEGKIGWGWGGSWFYFKRSPALHLCGKLTIKFDDTLHWLLWDVSDCCQIDLYVCGSCTFRSQGTWMRSFIDCVKSLLDTLTNQWKLNRLYREMGTELRGVMELEVDREWWDRKSSR